MNVQSQIHNQAHLCQGAMRDKSMALLTKMNQLGDYEPIGNVVHEQIPVN